MLRTVAIIAATLTATGAWAQDGDADSATFDACGVLVQGPGCVLFEGGGGSYVVVNTDRFQFGDEVRVVGTLDPACVTICPEADGCIRGAELYDPSIYPCGTSLPNFPEDLLTNVCAAASTTLLTLTAAGIWLTRRRWNEEFRLKNGE